MSSCTPIKSQTDIRNPLRYTALHMLLILTPLYKTDYIILCCIICNLNATSQLPLLFTPFTVTKVLNSYEEILNMEINWGELTYGK